MGSDYLQHLLKVGLFNSGIFRIVKQNKLNADTFWVHGLDNFFKYFLITFVILCLKLLCSSQWRQLGLSENLTPHHFSYLEITSDTPELRFQLTDVQANINLNIYHMFFLFLCGISKKYSIEKVPTDYYSCDSDTALSNLYENHAWPVVSESAVGDSCLEPPGRGEVAGNVSVKRFVKTIKLYYVID